MESVDIIQIFNVFEKLLYPVIIGLIGLFTWFVKRVVKQNEKFHSEIKVIIEKQNDKIDKVLDKTLESNAEAFRHLQEIFLGVTSEQRNTLDKIKDSTITSTAAIEAIVEFIKMNYHDIKRGKAKL